MPDLSRMFERIVRFGNLKVIFSSGKDRTYGDGSEDLIVIRLTDARAERAIALDPVMKFGEMFVDGRLVVEQGNIFDLMSLLKRNGLRRGASFSTIVITLWRNLLHKIDTLLPINRSKRNVAHHYDLDARLFDLFLDQDWQYSCAYFEQPDTTLDEAQLAKKRHLAAKLMIRPGQKLLDIGSGWGGLGIYLHEVSGADVTGVTLSEEQLAIARRRAEQRGIADKVRFELQDYRHLQGQFDRIVSVGMFEHVGERNFGKFFNKAAGLLDKHGIMVLHSIGRTRRATMTNPWVEKYIFPGGYIPALSEVTGPAEQAGLLIKDIEILPIHYARTLRHWRECFVARKEDAIRLYDERFFRMWEFYLAVSETAFLHDRMFVFQIQLARHQDAVPYTRDYIAKAEEQLKAVENARVPMPPVTYYRGPNTSGVRFASR